MKPFNFVWYFYDHGVHVVPEPSSSNSPVPHLWIQSILDQKYGGGGGGDSGRFQNTKLDFAVPQQLFMWHSHCIHPIPLGCLSASALSALCHASSLD